MLGFGEADSSKFGAAFLVLYVALMSRSCTGLALLVEIQKAPSVKRQ